MLVCRLKYGCSQIKLDKKLFDIISLFLLLFNLFRNGFLVER